MSLGQAKVGHQMNAVVHVRLSLSLKFYCVRCPLYGMIIVRDVIASRDVVMLCEMFIVRDVHCARCSLCEMFIVRDVHCMWTCSLCQMLFPSGTLNLSIIGSTSFFFLVGLYFFPNLCSHSLIVFVLLLSFSHHIKIFLLKIGFFNEGIYLYIVQTFSAFQFQHELSSFSSICCFQFFSHEAAFSI